MGDEAQVKVPGLEPTFRHTDDPEVTWQQVKAIRNADGSVSSVWEKWLALASTPSTSRSTPSGTPESWCAATVTTARMSCS